MVAFHPLTVIDIRRETEEAVSILFSVPPALRDAYRFAPGQYLTLRTRIEGEELRRSYSICSGINDNELRVAVKTVPEGKFSHFANAHLAVGDTLDVMTPDGRFTAPGEGQALSDDRRGQWHHPDPVAGENLFARRAKEPGYPDLWQ